MRMLMFEEREMLLMPNVPPENVPECKASSRQGVEFKRARWVWSNIEGTEYLILEDSEWTEKALRVDDLVRSLT